MPQYPDQTKPPAPAKTLPAKVPSTRFFLRNSTPFALDDARRQGDISQLAFLTMGGRDPAIAFLNTPNSALGGRPLAIATASPEGYERVAATIRSWPHEAETK
jgi:hypothetical protein